MKRIIKLLVVVALTGAIFGRHSSASAGGGGSFRFMGQNAVANFSSTDDSGCVVTDVYLWGSEDVSSGQPGRGTPSSLAYVFISRYDGCSDTQILLADGASELSEADFWVANRYEAATLQTPVTVYDSVSGNWFEVQLDLTWSAIGPLTRDNTVTHSNTPGCVITTRRNGTLRPAQVSGSVSDGSTNFTPEAAYVGSIASLKSGNVVIGCES